MAPTGSHCPALIHIFDDNVELGKRLCSFVMDRYEEAVSARGAFHVAVSGGSLPKFLTGLSKRADVDWTRWWVYFCDERFVGLEDPDSNYRALKEALLDLPEVSIPESQVLTLDVSLPLEEAASEYERRLTSQIPDQRLDIALCGMGPDGHTCSLFPGHPLLEEEDKMVASISDSPKLPPSRITLTLPLLRKSHSVVFVVTGESKVDKVVASLEGDCQETPAGRVRPTPGKLFWFMDTKAAAGLTNTTC